MTTLWGGGDTQGRDKGGWFDADGRWHPGDLQMGPPGRLPPGRDGGPVGGPMDPMGGVGPGGTKGGGLGQSPPWNPGATPGGPMAGAMGGSGGSVAAVDPMLYGQSASQAGLQHAAQAMGGDARATEVLTPGRRNMPASSRALSVLARGRGRTY